MKNDVYNFHADPVNSKYLIYNKKATVNPTVIKKAYNQSISNYSSVLPKLFTASVDFSGVVPSQHYTSECMLYVCV